MREIFCGRGEFFFEVSFVSRSHVVFYFCLLYIFSTLLLITTFNDLFIVNILLKISLVWGISLSIYHIYKILKRKPNKIEITIFIFLFLELLLTLIFYRNATNVGVPLLEAPGVSALIEDGEEIEVDMEDGLIISESGKEIEFKKLPPFMLEILESGGLINYLKNQKNE